MKAYAILSIFIFIIINNGLISGVKGGLVSFTDSRIQIIGKHSTSSSGVLFSWYHFKTFILVNLIIMLINFINNY